MNAAAAAFLLGFPALFAIVNPVSGAFIFRTRTVERSHAERVRLARRVGIYAALVMMVALWAGSYVLAFLRHHPAGAALRGRHRAGAVCLGRRSTHRNGGRRARTSRLNAAAGLDDVAFYPLTLPFTTGPGNDLGRGGAGRGAPLQRIALMPFFIGMSVGGARGGGAGVGCCTAPRTTSPPVRPGGQPRHHAAIGLLPALHRRPDPDHRCNRSPPPAASRIDAIARRHAGRYPERARQRPPACRTAIPGHTRRPVPASSSLRPSRSIVSAITLAPTKFANSIIDSRKPCSRAFCSAPLT